MAKSFRETIGVSPSSASTSDSTLLIIDAQNEYADGLLRTENVGSTRKAIAGLLEKYRAGSGSIVHIVHDTPQGAPVFTLGSQLAEEFDEVKAKDEETVIHKVYPGSFADTDLDNILKKTGKNKLVITGYMAHVCVSTTARQAAQRGYDVLLAEDAIGDRNIPGASADQVVKTVLLELGDAFGTVIKSSDVN